MSGSLLECPFTSAPVAQWIERRPPEPGARVRIAPGVPVLSVNAPVVPLMPLGGVDEKSCDLGRSMRRIEEHFSRAFQVWRIQLPREAVEKRRRGKIVEAGWTIWFLFGSDEDGEYLDYYSSHRMTNDSHVRIYEDGRVELLESLDEWRPTSDDPDENARLENEFWDHNERVSRLLEAKGFGLQGDELPSAIVRRGYLESGESNRRLSEITGSDDD